MNVELGFGDEQWLATALPDIEPRQSRICEYKHLSSAAQGDTEKLKIEIVKEKEVKAA